MTLKGTKTANNLMHAFAGESQARNRYTYYASIAKKRICTNSKYFLRNSKSRKRTCQKINEINE